MSRALKMLAVGTLITLATLMLIEAQPLPVSVAATKPATKAATSNIAAVMLRAPIAEGDLPAITADNAGQVSQLALLGRGRPGSLAWSSDGKTIAMGTALGIWLYQADALDSTPRLLLGHMGKVDSVAFSPDNKMVASLGEDGAIGLWDVGAAKLVTMIKSKGGIDSLTGTVSWSPDGKMVAAGSYANVVQIYDAATGKLLKSWKGHKDTINSVTFSPDGKLLASASNDKTIILWNTATGKPMTTLTGSTDRVVRVVFSPDGKTVASAGNDKGIRLWDVASGKFLTMLDADDYVSTPLAFSPDGKTLAGGLVLLDPATGAIRAKLECGGGNGMAFSPDGKTLAVAGAGAPQLCDASTGKTETSAAQNSVGEGLVLFKPDGKFLLYSGSGGSGQLWDITAGKIATSFKGYVGSGTLFSADSKILIGIGFDEKTGSLAVVTWDVGTGQQQSAAALEGISSIAGAAVGADGKILVTSTFDHRIRVWDATIGKVLTTLNIESAGITSGVLLSPDGKTLVVIIVDPRQGQIQFFDTTTGKATGKVDSTGNISAAFTPDGKLLAYTAGDSVIQFVDLTGKATSTLKLSKGGVSNITFSADGKLLAYQGNAGEIQLADAATGKLLATLQGHHGLLRQIVISPDGKLIASYGDDGTARLWGVSPK